MHATPTPEPTPSRSSAGRRLATHLGLIRDREQPDADTIGDYGKALARLHDDEREVGPLNERENLLLNRIRIFGATGSILLLIGSLGTGQIPVLQNPVAGTRVLSLPSRMWSTSLTLTVAGTIILVLAWLLIGRFAVGRLSVEVLAGRSPARRMTRKQADRTLLPGAMTQPLAWGGAPTIKPRRAVMGGARIGPFGPARA